MYQLIIMIVTVRSWRWRATLAHWSFFRVRFSIRSLLAAIAAVCTLLAVRSQTVFREREVIERLRAAAESSDEIDAGMSVVYANDDGVSWGAPGELLFYEAAGVQIAGSGVHDSDLAAIGDLRGLKLLRIIGAPQITNACLRHLATARRLRTLWLVGTSVTLNGLCELRGALPDCEVSWRPTHVRPTHFEWFDRFIFSPTHDQPGLMARGASIDDNYLAALPKIGALGRLYISEAPGVTDAGLRHLTGATGLKHMILHGTRATRRGVQDLRRALPGCTIDLLGAGPMIRQGFQPGWWGSPVYAKP